MLNLVMNWRLLKRLDDGGVDDDYRWHRWRGKWEKKRKKVKN